MRGSSPAVYGPYELSVAELAYRGWNGIYAVFACSGSVRIPIDVGESEDIGTRLRTHDRKRDWFSLLRQGLPVTFTVYATRTPAEKLSLAKGYRMWIESLWRQYYKALGHRLFGERP
jgi:hypothetical protein